MARSNALLRLAACPARLRQAVTGSRAFWSAPRVPPSLRVLGIETSADDTCVALMEIRTTVKGHHVAKLHSNEKVTCQNQEHKGIHPVEAVISHTRNLSRMVSSAVATQGKRPPDLICVTRGPGMGGCLSVGVSTAKALSDAWNVPIVGVHHMQAHALTPAMEAALRSEQLRDFAYPFLTLLVSGKHTMLVHTKSAVNHRILASTASTALGDALDKVARELVPPSWIVNRNDGVCCYPEVMEQKVQCLVEGYAAPQTRKDEMEIYQSAYGWRLRPPLRDTKAMMYNFTGLCSTTLDTLRGDPTMKDRERRVLATQFMRLGFEHLMSRVIIALETDEDLLRDPPKSLILSGGVASNMFLRTVAEETLKARGFGNVKLVVSKRSYCTDNAAMVAYAGYTMYESGWQTDQSFSPATKWSIEEILSGVDCWIRKPGAAPLTPEDAQSASCESSRADNGASPVDSLALTRDSLPSHTEQHEALPEAIVSLPSNSHPSRLETTVDETPESPGEEVEAVDPTSQASEETATDKPVQATDTEMDDEGLQLERILRQAESILHQWDAGLSTHNTSTSKDLPTAQEPGNVRVQAGHGKDSKQNVAATLRSATVDEPSSRKSSSARAQGAGDKVDGKTSDPQSSSKEQTQQDQQQVGVVHGDGAPNRKSPPIRDQAPLRAADATDSTATTDKSAAHDAKRDEMATKSARTSEAKVPPASDQAASQAQSPPEPRPQVTTEPDARRAVLAKLKEMGEAKPPTTAKVAASEPEKKTSNVWPVMPSEKERQDLKVHYLGFEDEPAPQRPSSFTGRLASIFGLGRT